MNSVRFGRRPVLTIVLVLALVSTFLAGCDYVQPLLQQLPVLIGEPTETPPAPTQTPMPTVTRVEPTSTPIPPTATPEPTATLMTGVLDASFVRDVTVPDGTAMAANEHFTKTWEIKNSGEVPWPSGTEMRLVEGEEMGPIASVALNSRAAGETADISVEMVAPAEAGTYRSYWQLCVGDACFGSRFYVEIRVRNE